MYETKTDQLAEVIEQEYKNPFGKDVDKEKLVNISSGVALDDDIGESILNMVNVGKRRMEDFRQKLFISKEISFHASIKKSSYNLCRHVVPNIRIPKQDGSVRVAEVNRNILETLNSYSLKIGKSVDFKKELSYSFSPVPLNLCHPDGFRRHTRKCKLKDILIQDLEDHVEAAI